MWNQDSGKRFVLVYQQGAMQAMEIWVDTLTGVQYLFHQAGYSGGMTPLLDKDGKVVVSSEYAERGSRL